MNEANTSPSLFEEIAECEQCDVEESDTIREGLKTFHDDGSDGLDGICITHMQKLTRLLQEFTLGKLGIVLPEGHDWHKMDPSDRGAFTCFDCDITIPFTTYDIQAGFRTYCPECNGVMERSV